MHASYPLSDGTTAVTCPDCRAEPAETTAALPDVEVFYYPAGRSNTSGIGWYWYDRPSKLTVAESDLHGPFPTAEAARQDAKEKSSCRG